MRGEGVQGVLTLFCSGAAQVCHDDRVVELKKQLRWKKKTVTDRRKRWKKKGRNESKRVRHTDGKRTVSFVDDTADLFTISPRNDDIQEFDSKWDGILLFVTKILSDYILEGLYKLRMRESEKRKTVLELYNLEIHRKNIRS